MELHQYALPGIMDKVVYLEADPKYRVVSSSAIKVMLAHDVDVSTMCPLFVKSKLERRLLQRYIIGITGGMGSGKSYVCRKVVEAFAARGIPAHHINLDRAIRAAMNEDSPGAQKMRDEIEALTGVKVPFADGVADLSAYKARLASGEIPLDDQGRLHEITEPHVLRHLRKLMRGKRGVLLFEWALMAENGLSHLCNHDVVVVSSPDQDAFLTERGVDPALAAQLRAHQWSDFDKAQAIRKRVADEQCGIVIEYPNPRGADPSGLADSIIRLFPGLENVR
jgi:dephospho-CoA kinase